jgi:hypothetical protein
MDTRQVRQEEKPAHDADSATLLYVLLELFSSHCIIRHSGTCHAADYPSTRTTTAPRAREIEKNHLGPVYLLKIFKILNL